MGTLAKVSLLGPQPNELNAAHLAKELQSNPLRKTSRRPYENIIIN